MTDELRSVFIGRLHQAGTLLRPEGQKTGNRKVRSSETRLGVGVGKTRGLLEWERANHRSTIHRSTTLAFPNSVAPMSTEQTHRRINKVQFRVLVLGRANAGKTSILQRVCETTESPKIYREDYRGAKEEVRCPNVCLRV